MAQAIAIDLAAESRVVPEPVYQCSAAANASAGIAGQHLDAGRRGAARAAFADALAACPGNARWWIQAGDVELRDGGAAAATRMFERGLAIDPWSREGHRYRSYAEAALGRSNESWKHAVFAVISDPTSETAWEFLRRQTLERGGMFHRQQERKPVAKATPGQLDLHLDPVKEISSSQGWVAYAIGLGTRELRLANLTCREPPKGLRRLRIDDEWAKWTPLERERYLVRTTLEQYQPDDSRPHGRTSKTWPVIKNAVEQGYLDEAIFIQLLDSALVPQFVEYRQAHADRLFDHVTGFLAVLPSGVGKRRSSQTAALRHGGPTAASPAPGAGTTGVQPSTAGGGSLLPHMRRPLS